MFVTRLCTGKLGKRADRGGVGEEKQNRAYCYSNAFYPVRTSVHRCRPVPESLELKKILVSPQTVGEERNAGAPDFNRLASKIFTIEHEFPTGRIVKRCKLGDREAAKLVLVSAPANPFCPLGQLLVPVTIGLDKLMPWFKFHTVNSLFNLFEALARKVLVLQAEAVPVPKTTYSLFRLQESLPLATIWYTPFQLQAPSVAFDNDGGTDVTPVGVDGLLPCWVLGVNGVPPSP